MRFIVYIACMVMLLPYLVLVPHSALARPVSYPGGTTIMQSNDMNRNAIHIHYSPTAKYSVGYRGEYWREQKWQFHGVQLNNLVKRWNKPASQANFYIKSGVGIVQSDGANNNDIELGAFTGFSLDWENRRFFTLYENRIYEADNINRFFMQQARVGVAPYIGNYGDLHTWLMLQVDHNPEAEDQVILTPLIRFLKSEYFAEFGINEKGKVLFNFIVRF